MENSYPVITIDGPSGAGKGTLAYLLAKHFGFSLLDSGALYRIVGLFAHQAGLLCDEKNICEDRLEKLTLSLKLDFVVNHQNQSVEIYVNNQPLLDDIRNETVGAYASQVAVYKKVRQALLSVQRQMSQRNGVVADGRDMGTVVFPDATAKIFLTASSQSRAIRRMEQLKQSGRVADYNSVLSEITARDERDQNRNVAPLAPAADALVIDSSTMGIDDVFSRALEFINDKIRKTDE